MGNCLVRKDQIMAFMNQEKKKAIAPAVKKILKKYGLKGTLRVRNHSTLVLTIREGGLDFIGNYLHVSGNSNFNYQVNEYHIDDYYSGKCAKALKELKNAMNNGNHDNSNILIDYFDVGWYLSINIGEWDKEYKLVS